MDRTGPETHQIDRPHFLRSAGLTAAGTLRVGAEGRVAADGGAPTPAI